ncbi:hypothetical protein, partial [Pseudomonas sp. 2822-17]|uniref:hypothetical protein n=1 Tax=Pseudomonas sp. 2822-17 TaxID=1712678 RepID=UPI00130450A0
EVTITLMPVDSPNEWKEIENLSPVVFKLMSYKENMLARMIRQSQALKLPIIYEDFDGNNNLIEVKSLSFQGDSAFVRTFTGDRIDLGEMKRVAIVNPQNNTDIN